MKNKQEKNKQVGVWMDHTKAVIIDSEQESSKVHVVDSEFQGKERIEGEKGDGVRLGNYHSTNNESHHHFRKQNETHAFYKHLANEISAYDEIFLFGPTTAHNEFHNYLSESKLFNGKHITMASSDYITDNQMRATVRTYFSEKARVQ